jgi:hypothetical protein
MGGGRRFAVDRFVDRASVPTVQSGPSATHRATAERILARQGIRRNRPRSLAARSGSARHAGPERAGQIELGKLPAMARTTRACRRTAASNSAIRLFQVEVITRRAATASRPASTAISDSAISVWMDQGIRYSLSQWEDRNKPAGSDNGRPQPDIAVPIIRKVTRGFGRNLRDRPWNRRSEHSISPSRIWSADPCINKPRSS